MYSGHSGQRRGFLRPAAATGSGPMFRNLPLFGFLTGLLFFFFIFYIYQAQSTELYDIRNQIELERSRHIKVKSENIDFKAQLEKCRSSEASLKNELQAVRLSQKECNGKLMKRDNTLSSFMMNLKQLQNDKNTCFTALDSMKAELALAKLTITALQANYTSLESVMETPKKTVESSGARLQGKDAQGSIPKEANLTASLLMITQGANEPESRKNTSVQGEKMVNKIDRNPFPNASAADSFQHEAVLPELVAFKVPEHIVTVTKSTNNLHAAAIVPAPQNAAQYNQLNFLVPPLQLEKQSLQARNEENLKFPNIPEAQLNFDNILEMNEQFPFVQKKDQTKKNMGNAYDFDRKQVIGSEYDNKELENA